MLTLLLQPSGKWDCPWTSFTRLLRQHCLTWVSLQYLFNKLIIKEFLYFQTFGIPSDLPGILKGITSTIIMQPLHTSSFFGFGYSFMAFQVNFWRFQAFFRSNDIILQKLVLFESFNCQKNLFLVEGTLYCLGWEYWLLGCNQFLNCKGWSTLISEKKSLWIFCETSPSMFNWELWEKKSNQYVQLCSK